VTFVGLVVFACGLAEPITVEILGRVYCAELLLPAAALVAVALGGAKLFRDRVFWILFLALLGMLLGYVVSDMFADTSSEHYLKGWGRVLFLISDFLALAIVTRQDKRNLWWFVLGVGLGGLVYFRFVEHLASTHHAAWKFSYANHAILAVSALASLLPRGAAAAALLALGAWNMYLDARSFSAMCVAQAGIVWSRANGKGGKLLGKIKLSAALAAAALVVLFLLNYTANEWSQQRRASSSVGRIIMLQVGVRLIALSPFIGFGSWGQSPQIASIVKDAYAASEDPVAKSYVVSGDVLGLHSQILQAWVEGGILAGVFFIIYIVGAGKALASVSLYRPWDYLSGPLVAILLSGLWHAMMSPFVATHRLDIAMALTAITLVLSERAAALIKPQPRSDPYPSSATLMRNASRAVTARKGLRVIG